MISSLLLYDAFVQNQYQLEFWYTFKISAYRKLARTYHPDVNK